MQGFSEIRVVGRMSVAGDDHPQRFALVPGPTSESKTPLYFALDIRQGFWCSRQRRSAGRYTTSNQDWPRWVSDLIDEHHGAAQPTLQKESLTTMKRIRLIGLALVAVFAMSAVAASSASAYVAQQA